MEGRSAQRAHCGRIIAEEFSQIATVKTRTGCVAANGYAQFRVLNGASERMAAAAQAHDRVKLAHASIAFSYHKPYKT